MSDFSYKCVHLIHMHEGVFNPNIPIYHPPNSAEGLHFSAFHYDGDQSGHSMLFSNRYYIALL